MSFQEIWEKKYRNNEGLNKYPWDFVVSFIFNYANRDISSSQQSVLELGFGAGGNLWFCAREGFRIFGVEASEAAVLHAKKYLAQDFMNLYHQNFCPLPFKDESIDLAFDRASLTCISFDEAQKVFIEVERVLKKGQYFLFSPYSKTHTSYTTGTKLEGGLIGVNNGSLRNVGNICFYDYQDIEALAKDTNFSIISCEHVEKKEHLSDTIHSEWHVIFKKAE